MYSAWRYYTLIAANLTRIHYICKYTHRIMNPPSINTPLLAAGYYYGHNCPLIPPLLLIPPPVSFPKKNYRFPLKKKTLPISHIPFCVNLLILFFKSHNFQARIFKHLDWSLAAHDYPDILKRSFSNGYDITRILHQIFLFSDKVKYA